MKFVLLVGFKQYFLFIPQIWQAYKLGKLQQRAQSFREKREEKWSLQGSFFLIHFLFPALSPCLSLISLLYPRDTRLVYFLHPAYANGDKHCLQCRLTVLKSEMLSELVVRALWKEGKKFKTTNFMQSSF